MGNMLNLVKILIISTIALCTHCGYKNKTLASSPAELAPISENIYRKEAIPKEDVKPEIDPKPIINSKSNCEVIKKKIKMIDGHQWTEIILKGSRNNSSESAEGIIQIYTPKNFSNTKNKRLLIALPGWNGKIDEWANNSKIVELADKYQFLIVSLDMKTSVYESDFYPETIKEKKWNSIPGLQWVGEVVMPFIISEYGIPANKTGIFGLSTGGEGAIFLVQHYPYFKACASLSGTFDLMKLPPNSGEYAIHASIFGDRKLFPERWKKESPASYLYSLSDKSIFLIHGKNDHVVSYRQSQDLYFQLIAANINAKVIIDPVMGHDWKLWQTYLKNVFDFFDQQLP